MNRRDVGILGEKLAGEFLKKKGYKILETNFRCREGEIDIVTKRKDYLVFVEVRTRTSADFGTPEESVTSMKKERLVNLAHVYINSHQNLPELWRIDFVAVELNERGKADRIEIIENAIS
jgi:putative endonuclease